MVKWDTITDDFPGSALGAEWTGTYGTTPTVSGNKLTFPSGSTYSGAGSQQYDLTSSSVLMKLDLASTTGLGYTALYVAGPGNVGIALIEFESGKLTGYIYGSNWGGSDSQSQITWSTSTTPVWVRFRHASSTLYLEYSTDGLSWTGLHNATPPSGMTTALATCNIEPNVGPTMTSAASFSKLNLAPTAVSVTPSRVNSSTAFYAPTPSSTSTAALSGRVAATSAVYLPSPGVASAVAPSRVNATSTVYLPNFSLGTMQVPNRVSAVAAVFTPAGLSSSGAAAPSRVAVLSVVYLPNIVTTRLSTATPQFENPAPENDGWHWRYNDTLGVSQLVPPAVPSMWSPVGWYFGPQTASISPGESADLSPGTAYFVPVFVPSLSVLDRIGLEVTTAQAAGVIRLGVYASDGDLPAELLVDAGLIDASTTGFKEIAIGISVSGLVWLAGFVPNGGSTGIKVRAGDPVFTAAPTALTVSQYVRGSVLTDGGVTLTTSYPATFTADQLDTSSGADKHDLRILTRRSA